jgi:hypothetical protein
VLREMTERGERATKDRGGANIPTASRDATPSTTLVALDIRCDQSSRQEVSAPRKITHRLSR